jgi:malto-oligosyltrehalose trehalohydrolase
MQHVPSTALGSLTSQRASEMKFGSQITATGTRFRLWAPRCGVVALKLERDRERRPMTALPRGWHELHVDGVGHGDLYRFVLENGTEVPDPASRFQPQDVLGPSEVIDPRRFAWTDVGWIGRPWEETVLYEMHVGTFTPEGTYAAAAAHLDHLVELGVTTLELMPVNDFPGRWNWGYDGALPFAPDASYGRPEDLKALVDAAHARNLTVLLDVVYNHFGPKGNFLPHYAPVLSDKHQTPWGDAVNFDGEDSPTVRDLVFANARYWLNEYHFDGLRLDAVHEIRDEGFNHVLHDLALQIRGSTDGRHIALVLENEENDPEWLRRTEDLVPGLYDAQWNDDLHHVIDTAIRGKDSPYNEDYAGRPDWLGKVLASGFGYQGEGVPSRKGAARGAPSADLPPVAFVHFIQNHDQIGNPLFGERIQNLAEAHKIRAAAAIYLLAPGIPLLFMGEEWGSETPFLFFSDVDPELADTIREQRLVEHDRFVPAGEARRESPDPMAESTFRQAKLDWGDLDKPVHRDWFDLYRTLLGVRRERIVPLLGGVGGHRARHEMFGGAGTRVEWDLNGGRLMLMANLSDEPIDNVEPWQGEILWIEGAATQATMEPWSVVWSLNESKAE